MDTTNKIRTSAELLADREWTEFLKRIPFGTTDWRIENYRDFVSLRSIASMLSKRDDCDRKFSLKQSPEDKTIYNIIVKPKEI